MHRVSLSCPPLTHTLAVINGAPLSTINQETLQNPAVLEAYVRAGEHLRGQLS